MKRFKFKYKNNSYTYKGKREFFIHGGENNFYISKVIDENIIDNLLLYIKENI